MADGTRLRDLQEAQKKLDQILQTESLKREAAEMKMQEQITTINSELLNMGKGKGVLEEESILGRPCPPSEGNNSRAPFSPRPRVQMEHQNMQIISPIPKLDFPRFDGSQARSWILKCAGYFRLIPNIPDTQKVTLASMHFEGKAAQWYQSFSMRHGELTWQQFVEIISARFEELKEAKIIAEFNKLKHTGAYSDYVDRFEELKACMLLLNKDYSEEYFVASFISGLSEELQSFINMFEPHTLQQTIDLGRKQIYTLEAISKRMKPQARPSMNSFPNNRRTDAAIPSQPKPPTNLPVKPPIKLLTASEMAARREKGLCYNCDEPFSFRHRCKQRITYMIMTEEEELSYIQEALNPPLNQMDEIQMSLNAISGEDGLTTMRLYGECEGHKLHILIDSGSTLSFIQEATAKRLGCKLEPAKPLLVKVANGQRMVSSYKATGFQWTMQGQLFSYSLRLLANKGCDLILGGDWLKSCTPIELDYEKMTVTVTLKGKRIKIQAMTSAAECKLISGPALYKMIHMDMTREVEEVFMGLTAELGGIENDSVVLGFGQEKGKEEVSIGPVDSIGPADF
ncbi:hypothetical protein DH2020_012684 [Rehmannia glutinosa]|uniref:Ty3 transposon capsid-like protein domain-containing protein n=1 Tax=Rehmannia glutinosa TaxID=99300 RepID=A0ABR0X3X6_REHGL